MRLVAGEDFRYTLAAPGLDVWLPDWLKQFDGRTSLAVLLEQLPEPRRAFALQLTNRLFAERVLVNAGSRERHQAVSYRLVIHGNSAWAWPPVTEDAEAKALPVLCQDRLDYDEALRFNRECLREGTPWMWATTGPMNRAYVSPLFLPDAGPCVCCLLNQFRRLSPAPELYDELIAHAHSGKAINPVPFPAPAVVVLQQLVIWKSSLVAEAPAPAALYRLHVLEPGAMEVSSHPVWIDPECPECGGRK